MKKLETTEIERLNVENFRNAQKSSICVILENIRSAGNVGSVFRTSDAFRVEKIFICGFTAVPPNKEIHKTALGAEDSVSWEKCIKISEVITALKSKGYKIIAVEQTDSSISLEKFKNEVHGKMAFIFGNEVSGVDQSTLDQCDGAVEIPQFGTKHSFNVSVCAGIVLWEAYKNNIGE